MNHFSQTSLVSNFSLILHLNFAHFISCCFKNTLKILITNDNNGEHVSTGKYNVTTTVIISELNDLEADNLDANSTLTVPEQNSEDSEEAKN